MSAHFVPADESCAGYWREFLECSDGRVVTGCGDSRQLAEARAMNNKEKRERYLRLTPKERLKILAEGDLLSTDMGEAVRLLIQIATEDNA